MLLSVFILDDEIKLLQIAFLFLSIYLSPHRELTPILIINPNLSGAITLATNNASPASAGRTIDFGIIRTLPSTSRTTDNIAILITGRTATMTIPTCF